MSDTCDSSCNDEIPEIPNCEGLQQYALKDRGSRKEREKKKKRKLTGKWKPADVAF